MPSKKEEMNAKPSGWLVAGNHHSPGDVHLPPGDRWALAEWRREGAVGADPLQSGGRTLFCMGLRGQGAPHSPVALAVPGKPWPPYLCTPPTHSSPMFKFWTYTQGHRMTFGLESGPEPQGP